MKLIRYLVLIALFLSVSFTQTSIVTIGGTGTAATSAHITIGTDGYKCPDEYVVEGGASLTTWDPSAICSASIADITISGFVKDNNNTGVNGVTVVFSNGGQTVTTNTAGFYTADVPYGWSGTSTPSKGGWDFTPANYTYTNVTADITDQDFVAEYKYVIIYGSVKNPNGNPLEGVDIKYSNGGGTVTTDVDGNYHRFITKDWSGTGTPSKIDYSFDPSSITYSSISTNQYHQDYVGTHDGVLISGYVRDINNNPIEGVPVAFSNGGATVITSSSGYYISSFTYGWGGTSTTTKDGWIFEPASYTYSGVTTNLVNQDYKGTDMALGIDEMFNTLPTDFTVLPAYPNPFNPSVTIRYGLEHESHTIVQIYDISGKLISTLVNEEQTQGWYYTIWNGTNQHGEQAPAGLYFSRIVSGNDVKTSKLMLLK